MPVRGKVTFDIEMAKYAFPYLIVSMMIQLVNCQTATATMMMRTIETAIFFRTPKECPDSSDPELPFRDVLLIDFLSSYTSISSDAGRGS